MSPKKGNKRIRRKACVVKVKHGLMCVGRAAGEHVPLCHGVGEQGQSTLPLLAVAYTGENGVGRWVYRAVENSPAPALDTMSTAHDAG